MNNKVFVEKLMNILQKVKNMNVQQLIQDMKVLL